MLLICRLWHSIAMMWLAIHASCAELASKSLLTIAVLIHVSLIVRLFVVWVTAIVITRLTLTVRLLVHML